MGLAPRRAPAPTQGARMAPHGVLTDRDRRRRLAPHARRPAADQRLLHPRGRRRRGLRQRQQADGRGSPCRRRRTRRRDAGPARQPACRPPRRGEGRRRTGPLPRRRPRGRRGRRGCARLRLRHAAVLRARADEEDLRLLGRRPAAGRRDARRGNRVGDFEVVHLPGHSPGRIGLCRAADRLAITNDCFALLHPVLPFPGRRPRIPHTAFISSDERCAESIAKLATLEPATCWPAHYGPLTGDVAAQLRAAI